MPRTAVERASAVELVVFDFDGVFTDNRVWILEDGREAVVCSRADGMGLAALKQAGVSALVLSQETNPVVGARCRKLRIPCIQGCQDKAERLFREAYARALPLDKMAYLGNDRNDIACLDMVGLPAAVADAWPEVKSHCVHITERPGGHGAVREFCDWLVAAKTVREITPKARQAA